MSNKFLHAIVVLLLIGFYGLMGYSSAHSNDTHQLELALAKQSTLQEAAPQLPKDYGVMRAQIALAEYKKGVHEATKGCNCGPDVDKYTLGLRQQWCAMFTSWVLKEAGSPLSNKTNDDSWRIKQARDIATWLDKNGTWYSKEDVIAQNLSPQIGDVMVFWRGDFEGELGHADIVVGIDSSKPGYASLVGGNLNDQVTLRQSYFFKDHYGFLGFGRPNTLN